jgi:tetratricopeptide (TPR) repeat protein
MDLEDKAEKAEENGDLETARTLRKEIAARNQDAASFVSYGRMATKIEEWDEAEGAFAEALRLDPTFSLAMEGMGILWYDRTDRKEMESFQIAKDWYLKAIRLDRNARVLTLLASSYLALGDSAAAQDALEQAIQADPRYEEAMYNLAGIYEEKEPARHSS